VAICVSLLQVSLSHTHTYTHTHACAVSPPPPEDANSKLWRLDRDGIIELILGPDSDGDISDCDQSDSDVYDN
jgi:hypothetical protein